MEQYAGGMAVGEAREMMGEEGRFWGILTSDGRDFAFTQRQLKSHREGLSRGAIISLQF